MPLHLSTSAKTISKPPPVRSGASKFGVSKSTSVNRSTTFGLGPSQWKIKDENHSAFLLENFRTQREKKEFTDITFTHDGESFSANRVILAALSPVMKNVFTKREDLMNGEILPPEALMETILFIYNAGTEVRLDVIKKIEKVSRVLQMHPITNTCSNLLATIPEFADDENGVNTKRLRQLPRQKTQESMSSHESTPLHHQASSDSNKSSSIDIPDGNGISASDISEILVGTKKGGRASIRLTVHSESGTTLSRSSDDVTQLSHPQIPQEEEALRVSESESLSPPPIQDQKNWEEKRKRFAFQKSPHNLEKDSNPKGKASPLLLSKLMQEAQIQDSDVISRTWPKRGVNSAPKRENLPQHWGPSTGHLMTSQPALKQIRRSSRDVGRQSRRPRLTQDKYLVSFKSRSIPNLLKGLSSLREQGLFCDVTLVVGNTRIQCHRSVLAASSAVFRTILSQVRTREIVLKKMEESAIQEIVRFIYTGQCSIDRDNVMTVMKGCLHFRVSFVARKCVSYLDEYATSSQNFFSPHNVLVAFKLGGEFGFQRLREESRKFAVTRFWDVIDTKSFRDLPWVDLNRLLSNDNLRNAKRDSDKEFLLLQALLAWLNHAPQSRAPLHTAAVMKYIAFTNIRPEPLSQMAVKEGIVMQNAEVRTRVIEAMRKQTSGMRSNSLQLPYSPLYGTQGGEEEGDIFALVSESSSKGISNKLYNLTPSENKSRLVAPTPVPLIGCAVTSYRGSVYVAGGRDGIDNKKVCNGVFRFSVSKGWTTLPKMIIPRSHFSLVPLDGAIYAIGGLSENKEKQYVVSTSCESLSVEASDAERRWIMTSWTLPQPSYSHAAVCCVVSRDEGNSDNYASELKSESKKKIAGSPSRRRGIRLSAPFIDVKSPVLNRASPKQGLGKNKKNQNSDHKFVEPSSLVFVCGGKINPRQNLLLLPGASNNFIEKSPLPTPCTSVAMTSRRSKIFIACDDVMETSQFRMFEYAVLSDQWSEMKIPIAVSRPLYRGDTGGHLEESEQPHNTSIGCTATPSGVYLAVGVNDVIYIERLNLNSLRWAPFTRTKLQSSATEFKLCSL